jgi:GTP-binding protein YchF
MGFNCGIVGLPNVGKSTLFNALTSTQSAEAANFPFCTIEPNLGRVGVPDPRLNKIAAIAKSAQVVQAQLAFVDIAGLVRGASRGEGLGNQFLANIRETDAVVMVLRCFEDNNITHVEGSVDPLRDAETIETELMLADLENVDKRLTNLVKKARGNDAESKAQIALLEPIKKRLEDGTPARTHLPELNAEETRVFKRLALLTGKPILYVANVDEESAARGNALSVKVDAFAKEQGTTAVVISANIEAEIAQLETEAEKAEYLNSLGLTEPGLNRLIRAGYDLLGLQTYFTAGPKEARAWTVRTGAKGPEAAGVIHSDFERGYIRAETIAYDDYIALNGEAGARDAGKLRQEGKEYLVQDGDVLHFKFNV